MRTFSRTIAATGALAALASAQHAYAIEPGSVDPHLPGISDGIPAGALPPAGFFFTNTLAYVSGSFQDGNGNPTTAAGINALAYVYVPVLTWSTNYHFLGAQYAAAIAQPLVTAAATTNGATQAKTGVFNTVLTPGILSWRLPMGFFVSANFSVYLNDGDTGDRGNGTSTQQHIANNTTTFAPGGAISWFNGHGLETSANIEYDVQTQNTNFANSVVVGGVAVPAQVKYQSGGLFNLDFSAVQVLPGKYNKWTVGGAGYYVVQPTSDQTTISGAPVPALNGTSAVAAVPGLNGPGNKFQRFALGPYAGYNFGPVSMQAWFTRDLFAFNTAQNSTLWFRFVVPL